MDGTISANTVHSISSFSELSDITLVISPSPVLPSHEYLCHKLILKARCPYFKSLFESGCMESTQTKVSTIYIYIYIYRSIYRVHLTPQHSRPS